MPIFEYRCRECEQSFEALVRGGESPECPGCRSSQLDKLLSASAAHTGQSRGSLPIASACPPSDAPPCSPHCCRLP
jgi:putative FmdB family regulatory protein